MHMASHSYVNIWFIYLSYQEEWRAIAATASTADDNRVHNWRRRISALQSSLSELKRKYSPVGLQQGAFCHKNFSYWDFKDNFFNNITLEVSNNQWLIQFQYNYNCKWITGINNHPTVEIEITQTFHEFLQGQGYGSQNVAAATMSNWVSLRRLLKKEESFCESAFTSNQNICYHTRPGLPSRPQKQSPVHPPTLLTWIAS